MRVGDIVLGDERRPHRAEGRELLAEDVLLPRHDRAHRAGRFGDGRHPVARRHVVDERIAGDIVERVLFGDGMARPADHGAELAFPIDHVGVGRRQTDRGARADDGGDVLREMRRRLGRRRLHLLQVRVIIHAAGEDEAGIEDRRQQLRLVARHERARFAQSIGERRAGAHLIDDAAHQRHALAAAGDDAAHGMRQGSSRRHGLVDGAEVEDVAADADGGAA